LVLPPLTFSKKVNLQQQRKERNKSHETKNFLGYFFV